MANWFSFSSTFFLSSLVLELLSLNLFFQRQSTGTAPVLWLGKECWKCEICAFHCIDVIASNDRISDSMAESGCTEYVNARLDKISISFFYVNGMESFCSVNRKFDCDFHSIQFILSFGVFLSYHAVQIPDKCRTPTEIKSIIKFFTRFERASFVRMSCIKNFLFRLTVT